MSYRRLLRVAAVCGIVVVLGCEVDRPAPSPWDSTVTPDSITIARDTWGVPHVFAPTDPGVAYGLGWAHAEDEFGEVQRTLLRGKGMMGRLKGREGAPTDYVVALLGIPQFVEQNYEEDLSADYRAVLRGYAEGLNAYARAHPEEILVADAFPMTPKDIMQAYVLFFSQVSGVGNALENVLGGNAESIGPPGPRQRPSGSNGIAMNENITADGATYVAINPHNPFEGPISWYEAHLSSDEGWNIHGALFPGSAVAYLGANEHLGWAHTANFPDLLDVYELTMHPERENQYRFDGTWRTLETDTTTLNVSILGGLWTVNVDRPLYRSVYGPTVKTDNGVYSFRLGALQDLRAPEQWYRMNKASSFAEFKGALEMGAIPGFNVVYGDRVGNVYYLGNGKIPVRDSSFDWAGIVPGDTSATLWTDFHPVEALPQITNPDAGYVYNFNTPFHNATAPAEDLPADTLDPTMGFPKELYINRGIRFREMMSGRDSVTWEAFKRMKYDRCLPSDTLRSYIDISSIFELDSAAHPSLAPHIRTLKEWDRCATIDSEGAALYWATYKHLHPDLHQPGGATLRVYDKEETAQALGHTVAYMKKYFGTAEVPLGQYQRHVRGGVDLPVGGMFDVMAATDPQPFDDGRAWSKAGDSFVELVRFTEEGPEIQTITAYGASNDPESPHYTDQMHRYVQEETKTMTLDRDTVLQNAERVYAPK